MASKKYRLAGGLVGLELIEAYLAEERGAQEMLLDLLQESGMDYESATAWMWQGRDWFADRTAGAVVVVF